MEIANDRDYQFARGCLVGHAVRPVEANGVVELAV